MPRFKMGFQLCAVGIAVAILFLAVGCSDDECPVTPVVYGDPGGGWDVTSTNVDMTWGSTNLPTPFGSDLLVEYVKDWIEDAIFPDTSQWGVGMSGTLFLRSESTACLPMLYSYDATARSCDTRTPIDIQDQDVSDLGLCVDITVISGCVMRASVTADVEPDLTWTEDFMSFSGSEEIGDAQNFARLQVYIVSTSPLLPTGWYYIDFYGSRDVAGTRCDGCNPCTQ